MKIDQINKILCELTEQKSVSVAQRDAFLLHRKILGEKKLPISKEGSFFVKQKLLLLASRFFSRLRELLACIGQCIF